MLLVQPYLILISFHSHSIVQDGGQHERSIMVSITTGLPQGSHDTGNAEESSLLLKKIWKSNNYQHRPSKDESSVYKNRTGEINIDLKPMSG